MAKLKTHKSTAKRFKITKTGKLIHNTPGWNHLKSKKDAKIKYRKKVDGVLNKTFARNLKKLLPGTSLN